MYDPQLTDRAIQLASDVQIQDPLPGRRWALQRHTAAQRAQAVAYFDAIVDEETGRPTRPLTREEDQFIQNERRVCALDFWYFLGYVHIIDDKKRDRIFTPNLGQSIIMALWGESERKGHAIMFQALKARQLGISTLSEIALLHRFLFISLTYAVIASADPFKTVEMSQMIAYAWEKLPWWLVPDDVKFLRGVPAEIPSINSKLKPQWGNQFHGVGRGQTPNVAHLSELSSWADASDDVDSALLRAIHPTPDVFFALESTALGRDNWWFEAWQLNKVEYPAGRSLIRPIFLPWFAGTDLYPTPTDLQMRPIPPDWTPLDRTIRHAERARQAVLANPLWLQYIAHGDRGWHMPLAQMWFYECERELALKKKGGLNKFLSEMPADDQEAFQNTAISVIDQEIILEYREQALAVPPLGVFTIIGDSIHKSLTVPRAQWDLTKPSYHVNPGLVCRAIEQYHLMPVKFEGYIACDPMWKLFVWEWPEDNELYGIGVDTSDGIGEDWSVIEVFRKGRFGRPHAQVAEFASPYIKANQLWDMALTLGTMYSTFHHRIGRRVQCRICVECRGNGEKTQDELKKRGWRNFHPWKKLDNRKRLTNDKIHKEGVFTNVWYRSMMMDTLLTQIDEKSLELHSPWLINEFETLERDPEEKSARAAYNTHDDRVMAIGFPLESLTVDDRQRTRYRLDTPQYVPDALMGDTDAPVSYATYKPPTLLTPQMAYRQPRVQLHVRPAGIGRAPRTRLGRVINRNMPRGYR